MSEGGAVNVPWYCGAIRGKLVESPHAPSAAPPASRFAPPELPPAPPEPAPPVGSPPTPALGLPVVGLPDPVLVGPPESAPPEPPVAPLVEVGLVAPDPGPVGAPPSCPQCRMQDAKRQDAAVVRTVMPSPIGSGPDRPFSKWSGGSGFDHEVPALLVFSADLRLCSAV